MEFIGHLKKYESVKGGARIQEVREIKNGENYEARACPREAHLC